MLVCKVVAYKCTLTQYMGITHTIIRRIPCINLLEVHLRLFPTLFGFHIIYCAALFCLHIGHSLLGQNTMPDVIFYKIIYEQVSKFVSKILIAGY